MAKGPLTMEIARDIFIKLVDEKIINYDMLVDNDTGRFQPAEFKHIFKEIADGVVKAVE